MAYTAVEVQCPHVVTTPWVVRLTDIQYVWVCLWREREKKRQKEWEIVESEREIDRESGRERSSRRLSSLQAPTWNRDKKQGRCLVWSAMVTHIFASPRLLEASLYVSLHTSPRACVQRASRDSFFSISLLTASLLLNYPNYTSTFLQMN